MMESDACHEEVKGALKRNSDLATLAIMHSEGSWQRAQAMDKFNGWKADYDKMLNHEQSIVPSSGDFMNSFWPNIIGMVKTIQPCLRPNEVVCAAILCAPQAPANGIFAVAPQSDREWAERLSKDLEDLGFKTKVCSTSDEWKECAGATILIPVLSLEFYAASECYEIMQQARQQHSQEPLDAEIGSRQKPKDRQRRAILPLLRKDFDDDNVRNHPIMQDELKVPYLVSIMNTANRIPANTTFDNPRAHNMDLLKV